MNLSQADDFNVLSFLSCPLWSTVTENPGLLCLRWVWREIRQTWPPLLDLSSISINCLSLTERIVVILTVSSVTSADIEWNPTLDWILPCNRSWVTWSVLLRCSASNSASALSTSSQRWCVYAASPFPLDLLNEIISGRIKWHLRPQNFCMVGTCWQFIHTELQLSLSHGKDNAVQWDLSDITTMSRLSMSALFIHFVLSPLTNWSKGCKWCPRHVRSNACFFHSSRQWGHCVWQCVRVCVLDWI